LTPALRAATAADTEKITTIWYAGWRDGHLGNVPDELTTVRTPASFRARTEQRLAELSPTELGPPPTELGPRTDPPAAGFEGRVERRLAGTVVAVVDGEVVGFVMVSGDEVDQVYVAASSRGTGVAALLLAEAESMVAAAGHSRAWLAVVAGNIRARRFYQRHGWTDDGPFTYEAATADGTIGVTAHRYVKRL
jgi:GNAT superfamily N-acetyltransferase